jgi:hypothetical protein
VYIDSCDEVSYVRWRYFGEDHISDPNHLHHPAATTTELSTKQRRRKGKGSLSLQTPLSSDHRQHTHQLQGEMDVVGEKEEHYSTDLDLFDSLLTDENMYACAATATATAIPSSSSTGEFSGAHDAIFSKDGYFYAPAGPEEEALLFDSSTTAVPQQDGGDQRNVQRYLVSYMNTLAQFVLPSLVQEPHMIVDPNTGAMLFYYPGNAWIPPPSVLATSSSSSPTPTTPLPPSPVVDAHNE